MFYVGAGRLTSSPARGEANLSLVNTTEPVELGLAEGVRQSVRVGVRVCWVVAGAGWAVTWAVADVKPLPDE